MAEALAAVKYDLGQDAVILNTRSFKRGGLLGLGRRTIVEVTASARDPGGLSNSAGGNVAAQKAYAAGKGSASSGGSKANSASGERPALSGGKTSGPMRSAAVQALASEADRQRTRRLAMAMQEQQQRRAGAAASGAVATATPPAPVKPAPVRVGAPAAPIAAAVGGATAAAPIPLAPAAATSSAIAPSGGAASMVMAVPATTSNAAAKRFILRSADAANEVDSEPAASAAGRNTAMQRPVIFEESLNLAAHRAAGASSYPSRHTTPAGIVSLGASNVSAAPAGYANPSRPGLRHVAVTDPDGPVREELAAIKHMVGQVLQRQVTGVAHRTPSMPQALFDQYLALVSHDLPEELAETIVNEVRDRLDGVELADQQRVHRAVVEHLADYLPVSPTPLTATSSNGRPLTLALVGPTGVGKTTTLAKLAASFKLKAGRKVGLITSDTYRIAAVDQLRTYANIIGLPLQVVLTPADMRQAVHALSSPGGAGAGSASACDVILIDTAGRSQNDTLRIAELREFIDAAHPHEVHMVLSATAGEKVLNKEASAFGSVGVNKVILTKMDEAASLGPIVSMLKQINRPVSFITTGQEVPDHLESAKSERLAALVMGGEVHA
jgi:flagellar biosynthesis protein FlhF